MDGQGTLQSPGSGKLAGKKKKIDKDKATTSKTKSHSKKLVISLKNSKLTKDTTDQKLPGSEMVGLA